MAKEQKERDIYKCNRHFSYIWRKEGMERLSQRGAWQQWQTGQCI